MNTFRDWMLIRELVLLGFVTVVFLGGLLLARLGRLVRRRPPASLRETSTRQEQRLEPRVSGPGYHESAGQAEANDADVPAPARRRAA